MVSLKLQEAVPSAWWIEIAITADVPGEVYVLNDGGETDLDLGNYERYLDVSLGRDNNVTTGKVYQYVIEREVSPPPQRFVEVGS